VREEAEASAFALEFLCPSNHALDAWLAQDGATIAAVAQKIGVDLTTARIQLANALHDLATGAGRPEVAPANDAELRYTQEQLDAARHEGSAALVDAGPGTGKTSTLIKRVEFALVEKRVAPSRLLALTFSNEASLELYERLTRRFGIEAANDMTIATFHGFGMELLHWHGEKLGLPQEFALLDEDAEAELVAELLGRAPYEALDPLMSPGAVANKAVKHIDYLKHRRISPDALAAAVERWAPPKRETLDRARELLHLYRAYESEKAARSQVDFADLVLMALGLFENYPEIARAYREKYPWVLVDEFQDVTSATSQLLAAICGAENPPWVVGDARQAIYQFMGADPRNVRDFSSRFPESKTYVLPENHRSSEPIVKAANELASLFPDGVETNGDRWKAVGNAVALGKTPVTIAEGTSDFAEAEGIVDQIVDWRDAGVPLGDIAVLARRHVDVRNVVLALGERGIKAESAGLLTADGAAGDLSVVLTVASEKYTAASIPRLTLALGRGRFSRDQINATTAHLLDVERTRMKAAEQSDATAAAPERGSASVSASVPADVPTELMTEVTRARQHAELVQWHADGFECLTSFLFDGSDYLRRVLRADDSAVRAMTLVEIVSTLSLATSYRATHPAGKRHRLRHGFATRLRQRLTETVPIPIAPKPRPDAVRVMTCHGSKGLEFPCVIVAGQTLPLFRGEQWPWIPLEYRPETHEGIEQANALLFVGVTRAKRAVRVSYPARATNSERSQPKQIVPLLERWRGAYNIATDRWNRDGGTDEHVDAGPVWGPGAPESFRPRVLDDGNCAIRTYLEDVLGLQFPEAELSLYPVFFGAVRKVLRALAKLAIENGNASAAEADALLQERFPEESYPDHPHYAMYRAAAQTIVRGFANGFKPAAGTTYMDPELEVVPNGGTSTPVRLDLVARFREPSGSEVAIGFRPESRVEELNAKGILVWSKMAAVRIPYVLVWQSNRNTSARVYSGADGTVHHLAWHRNTGGMEREAEEASAKYDALVAGNYATDVKAWECERRCRMRVTCPYWLGALS
jgi:superfamily I DNA/RNA helicase